MNLRYGLDNWIWAIGRLLRLRRRGRRQAAAVPPGLLPVQAGRLAASSSCAVDQQHLGRSASARELRRVRLDREQRSERLHADPEPLSTRGSRGCRRRRGSRSPATRVRAVLPASPTPTSARWTCTAASPPAPATTSTPRASSRRSTGTGSRSSAEPTGHLVGARACIEPQGAGFVTRDGWNLLAERRRVDRADRMAQVGPDGARLGDRLVQLHRPAQPDARGLQNGKGNAYETAAARQERTAASTASSTRTASRRRRSGRSTATDRAGLLEALERDNMFWRLHAQRLLVERGQKDVVPQLVALMRNTVGRRGRHQRRRVPCAVDAAGAGRDRVAGERRLPGGGGRAEAPGGGRPEGGRDGPAEDRAGGVRDRRRRAAP